jgi:hypothetical protein
MDAIPFPKPVSLAQMAQFEGVLAPLSDQDKVEFVGYLESKAMRAEAKAFTMDKTELLALIKAWRRKHRK